MFQNSILKKRKIQSQRIITDSYQETAFLLKIISRFNIILSRLVSLLSVAKWSCPIFVFNDDDDVNMMMNCFCGMVDRQKVFSVIFSRDHCQRFPPSQISDTSRAGFEPAQNLSSDLVEWSCAVSITTTP